jgi:Cof subfamily protein (haloacid dehalogenase superfamily)
MKDIKLLILDIDGTIAGASNQVSESVKQAIAKVQDKGIKVALATGRMYCSAKRFHDTINGQLPIIAYNGAWIQSPQDGQIHSHIPVPKQIASELLEYYQNSQWRSQVEVHFYCQDRLYVQEITEKTKSYSERSQVEAMEVDNLQSLLDLELTKVLALCHHPDLTRKLAQNLKQRYLEEEVYLTQSNPIYLEATHPLVNKGFAVQYLAEKILNLTSLQVMAIGDNFNDLAMLEYAGFSVAMGDAPQAVKDQVDWVTKNVEQDGVAVALEKFLL